MDTNLRPSGEEVLKLNAELEQRVAERTAELAFINERLRAEIVERMRVETELRYHAYLLENVQDAIIATDEKFAVTSWNSAAENIYGWAAEEVLGKIVHNLLRSEFTDAERAEALRSLYETGRFHTEVLQHKRDGKPIWVEGLVMALRDSTGEVTGFVTVNRDVTEHKQAEEALRQREFDLVEAQRVARLGSWRLDINTNTIRWSEELYRIFDVEKAAFDSTYGSFLARIHPDDQTRVLQVNAEARSNGEPFEVEYRVTKGNGELKHIREAGYARKDRAGAVSGLFGTAQDITEHKQTEEAIRKSEQVLREAESLGHTGSWEQNLVTGEIFNTEENLHLFFGDDHSMGTPLDDYAQAVHPDDREYVMQRRVQLLAEGGPGDIEFRVVWPDGSVHILFGRSTVVYDELGQAIRVYGPNVDMTERKKAEADNRRYAAQMA